MEKRNRNSRQSTYCDGISVFGATRKAVRALDVYEFILNGSLVDWHRMECLSNAMPTFACVRFALDTSGQRTITANSASRSRLLERYTNRSTFSSRYSFVWSQWSIFMWLGHASGSSTSYLSRSFTYTFYSTVSAAPQHTLSLLWIAQSHT